MAEKIFFWIGIVVSIGVALILLLAFLQQEVERFMQWLSARKQEARLNEYREISVILGVKVPTTEKKPYTPIAYIYNRKKKDSPPIVTIINASFFKKLPDDTNLFVVSKDTKYDVEDIKTVRSLKRALTLYQKSISSEGWD